MKINHSVHTRTAGPLPTTAWLRRVGAVFVVLMASLLHGGPASAHGSSESPSSNYVSEITDIKPARTSFTAKIIEAGSRIELRWISGGEILVPDYDDHPYLRIGPDGVEQNMESTAVYLNSTRMGGAEIPEGLKPEGPPRWERISSEPVARWHDHRIHYMGLGTHPRAVGKEDQEVLLQRFVVFVQQDGESSSISGVLRWVPGPSPLPYYAIAAALAIALTGIAFRIGRAKSNMAATGLLVGVAGVILLVSDIIHLTGIVRGVAGPLSDQLSKVGGIGFVPLLSWIVLTIGLVMVVLRRKDSGLYLVTFGAGIVFLIGGLSDLSTLKDSSVVFSFGASVARWCVTAAIGLGLGLVVSGIVLTRPARVAASTDLPTEPAS